MIKFIIPPGQIYIFLSEVNKHTKNIFKHIISENIFPFIFKGNIAIYLAASMPYKKSETYYSSLNIDCFAY